MAKNGHMAILATDDNEHDVAIMSIQWKNIEKLVQPCWFQLNRTIVIAVSIFLAKFAL